MSVAAISGASVGVIVFVCVGIEMEGGFAPSVMTI